MSVEEHGLFTSWSVTDDGPGISEADQARLFERFFVGRNDRSGRREGVGLGLPTALAIAQAHGGTIGVRSALGRGSTFALIVPTAGPEDDDVMRILVVDDEPDVVESVRLGFTLQWREVEVLGADTGEAALDIVERQSAGHRPARRRAARTRTGSRSCASSGPSPTCRS